MLHRFTPSESSQIGPSIKINALWNFTGNAVNAAGQWAILILIAKLGSGEMLGQYALAVAVSAPVALFLHMNLRAVLVTDVAGAHTAGDYLSVRLWTTAVGMLLMAAISLASGYPSKVVAAILFCGASQCAETLSDLYYGFLQRREQMDRIALSMSLRTVLSLGVFTLTLWSTGTLLHALGALALSKLAFARFYDHNLARGNENWLRTGWKSQAAILRAGLPLGGVLMLGSLNVNLPRYIIESELGVALLGGFAAVASLATVGSAMIHAIGQAAVPRLARYMNAGERAAFRLLGFRICSAAVTLGLAGVLVAQVAGSVVLSVVYRPEYARFQGLLTLVMCAAVFQYLAIMLGYVLTSRRIFALQIPLLGMTAAVSGMSSWLMVPRLGLTGGALALGLSGMAQTLGAALILFHALRSEESPRANP